MERTTRKALAIVIPSGFSLPDRPADLSDRRLQRKLSPSASKAFVRMIKSWDLKDDDSRQLLGGISAGLFYEIKRGDRKLLDQDQLTRISLLLGIYKALAILFPEKLAQAWPSRPNDNVLFNGATPVSYMVSGGIPAMLTVRQLLDARRGVR
jgi:Antitoxin Xre-like helix-turn-helix domain/Antitoxin Xre/MbcA/ParS C-terminal toxin-binding domain